VTFATFTIATAAIAGIPPLAGFFSKDEILWFAFASNRGGSGLLYATIATTALLTSFYMFRLVWLTFFGRSRMSAEVEHHVHESPLSMTSVLVVLAILSAVGGFLSIPHFLEPLLPSPDIVEALEHYETPLLVTSIVLAFAGLGAAAYMYGGAAERAERARLRFPTLHRVLSGKYYVDEAYDALIGRPLVWISERIFLGFGDRTLFDGTLHGLAALGRRTAAGLSRVQNGNLHLYALLALFGIIVSIAWGWRHV
jgi:NADH-quinone oxidoreductase subunit L